MRARVRLTVAALLGIVAIGLVSWTGAGAGDYHAAAQIYVSVPRPSEQDPADLARRLERAVVTARLAGQVDVTSTVSGSGSRAGIDSVVLTLSVLGGSPAAALDRANTAAARVLSVLQSDDGVHAVISSSALLVQPGWRLW